ncbi:MAG: phytoene dehydrogenase, partial [Planctomycetota bacterium]
LMYYGSAVEGDMEFGQFVIMFKSIFCEGFARPQTGVRQILILLNKKYKECGGAIRMSCGVDRLLVENQRVTGVQLETGEVLTAEKILSSAGYPETMKLCSNISASEPSQNPTPGVMTFMETISVLDCDAKKDLGHETTIIFFNRTEQFRYQRAKDLIDVNSGVICCPNNFQLKKPLPHSLIRITNIANFDLWDALNEDEYLEQKEKCYQASMAKVTELIPDFRSHIIFQDIFTPKTIKKFTGHLNGAVYGCPEKRKDGTTYLKNLFLCGTDQGFLGIIGAMLSGISMANLHTLK